MKLDIINAMISKDSIEALKTHLDIVDVVGNYIELKKNGANFKAPCPFHDEKTPSFVVSPQKQIYHCFGCGAGGGAIDFVMEYEKLAFPDAIEKLAQLYNFSLSYEKGSEGRQLSTKMLDTLNSWFQKNLEHQHTAKAYLNERGMFESSVEKFEIGFAPASHLTMQFFQNHHINLNEALELGVAAQENGCYYARFSERIIFPIYNENSKLVGFGGRTITGHVAKYINSPQTKLYNKSKILYAYNLAKKRIFEKKEVLVTEGYLDVIMLHQAGFTHAVATLGTALTAEHIPLLKKSGAKVILAYDGDNAGIEAALKASKLLSKNGFDGGVVIFESGFDPADMVKAKKIDTLNEVFHQPEPFIDFVINSTTSKHNLQDPTERNKALQSCTEYLSTLPPLVQEHYKGVLGSKFGINASYVKTSKQRPSHEKIPQPARRVNAQRDEGEIRIIKSLLEHPHFIDQLLDYIDPEMFHYHRQEFEIVMHSPNDPVLNPIVLNDSIKTLTSMSEIKEEIRLFLIKHYKMTLQRAKTQQHVSFEKKAFILRSLQNKLSRLEKGELIPIEA